MKDEFYDNLGHTLNKFPLSRIRIAVEDFNAKLRKKKIFRTIISNRSLHDVTSENGITYRLYKWRRTYCED